MKLYLKMLVPPAAALFAVCAPLFGIYGDVFLMDGTDAVIRELRSQAQSIAGMEETRQFLRGFTHSGMESLVRDAVSASFVLTHVSVLEGKTLLFSYPEQFPCVTSPGLCSHAETTEAGESPEVLSDRPGAPIRVFEPILDNGELRGFVVAETTMASVTDKRRRAIFAFAVCAALGAAAAAALALRQFRRIRRELLGMDPEEIANKYHSSVGMMETLHEGVVAIDAHGTITLSNKAAKNLLGMRGRDINARRIQDIMPSSRLPEVVVSGRAEYDREQRFHGRVLIANRVPIVENGVVVGAMSVFRDKSQVVRLAEELTGARQLVDSLRAATHEFRNKTHVILGVLERGHVERAKQYILDIHREKNMSHRMADVFRDPVVSGLVLAKGASCGERGVVLAVADGSALEPVERTELNHSLVTIVGNLVDNAMESASARAEGGGRVTLGITETREEIAVRVADNGAGVDPESVEKIFIRGYTTKGEGHGTGLFLVKQAAESTGGGVTVRSSRLETVFTVTLRK